MLTTLAMVAALLSTPTGKTAVTIAEVTGQGTATLAVAGTFSCTSAAVERLTVTVNDRATPFTYTARVAKPITCPATDEAFRVELVIPGSVWWHRKLTVYADLADPDTVRAASSAPVDDGTLLAVAVRTTELTGGNLVVSGTVTGATGVPATITVDATQGEVHGETTIPLPANKSFAVPVHTENAKVFLSWQPVDFVVTLAGQAVEPAVSGTFTPPRRPRPVPRTP